MYDSIENQEMLHLPRHCLWKSHTTKLNAKRKQEFDAHFIAKGSDVKKRASIARVKETGFLAKHNLRRATSRLSKSIFPDSANAKEHSYS